MTRFLRNFNSNLVKLAMGSKNIATSSVSFTDAVEELKINPYYEKYAKKIAKLQATSPGEYQSRVASYVEKRQPKASAKSQEQPMSSGTAKPIQAQQMFTKPKKLDDVMKTALLKDKTADEIKSIWLEYHKHKDVIVAAIPKDSYEQIFQRGQEFGTFLFPIPRNQGYEFILSQFYGHEVHFTPLIAYQTHKENAPECLTVVHYPDLMESKAIVLMKGEFNTDVLQCHEAQCLLNQFQLYYAQNNEKRLKLLERFTYSPNDFKHMDLIAELECLSI